MRPGSAAVPPASSVCPDHPAQLVPPGRCPASDVHDDHRDQVSPDHVAQLTRGGTPGAPAAVARHGTGTHALMQQDGANCSFSDAPKITGSFELTVQSDGSVSGRLAAEGSGTRDVSCGDAGGRMNWHQKYVATFTGRVSNGRLTATGTLHNVNTTTLTGCTIAGHPSALHAV